MRLSYKNSQNLKVLEYTSNYQADFDKVTFLHIDSSPYTQSSIKTYF